MVKQKIVICNENKLNLQYFFELLHIFDLDPDLQLGLVKVEDCRIKLELLDPEPSLDTRIRIQVWILGSGTGL